MTPSVGTSEARAIEDVLAKEEVYVSTTVGVSMRPMLRDRRDTVVVRPAEGRLRPMDVALYRHGDAYVLHRVVEVREGGYVILGDNCLAKEIVNEEQIIGVLSEFYRGERRHCADDAAVLAYARAWYAAYPLRACLMRARAAAARAYHRLAKKASR